MKSFKSSLLNLSHAESSSASISPASLLAEQCIKAFDQIPTLLGDVRSISTPDNVLTVEFGLERAVDSGIGNTLAEIIMQYVGNCSKKESESIQTALSAATTNINTCSEITKRAQKKKRLDKDAEKRLEEHWFLFCMQMIKISKILPLGQTDLQSVHALWCDASDVNLVANSHSRIRSYHTMESRQPRSLDHSRTSSNGRSRSSVTESTVTSASKTTRSPARKLQKHKSHSTLVSLPPTYNEAVEKRYTQEKVENGEGEVLPVVQSSHQKPNANMGGLQNLQDPFLKYTQNKPMPQTSGLPNSQGLFPNYSHIPQLGSLVAPSLQPMAFPMFPQTYYRPAYQQQPLWLYTPPVAHRNPSSITETVTKHALNLLHPELQCPCHTRHSGDHLRCWRNCCIWMGCF